MDVRMQSLQKHFEWKEKSKLYHVYPSAAGRLSLAYTPVLRNLTGNSEKI